MFSYYAIYNFPFFAIFHASYFRTIARVENRGTSTQHLIDICTRDDMPVNCRRRTFPFIDDGTEKSEISRRRTRFVFNLISIVDTNCDYFSPRYTPPAGKQTRRKRRNLVAGPSLFNYLSYLFTERRCTKTDVRLFKNI